ncbi:MAG: hypothetical protein EBR82_24485 [Caulobacteraceae bacterium]|nr:hypothetical protein [Caulobacteraceae bacterium]
MFNQVSYNVVIERLKAFASGHLLIKQFTHGDPANIFPTLGEEDYPLMHVTPTQIGWATGERSFSFTIVFADIPRDKETVAEYQREIVSDCLRLAEDLLAEIKNGGVIFGQDVTLDTGPQATPFMAEYTHTLTGIQLTVGLTFPWNWSACDIPADWAPGGSGSGGSGGGFGLVLKVNNVNNVIQTVLDLVDGTNTTVTDLGDGRVRIDAIDGAAAVWGSITGTLSSQTDLQSALDLKADISSLALVAFSGDYNDLSNLPTIPAAQIQSDWNQANNTALDFIKNKPSLNSGTVTSVGLSISQPINPAFTVSGSPVTTSGTLTLTSNGTSLQYIDGTGALKTFPAIPKTLSDFLTGSQKGDLIQWNGTAWVVIGLLAIDDLADVNAGTPTNGQMLIYNSGSNQWVASTYTPPHYVTVGK